MAWIKKWGMDILEFIESVADLIYACFLLD